MSQKSSKYFIFFLSLLVILSFSAFGCKKTTTKEAENQTSTPSGEVSYNTNNSNSSNVDNNINNDSNNASNSGENKGNTTSGGDNQDNTSNNNNATADKDKLLLEQAGKLAEVYGTYTNKDKEPYKNLKDLKQYSTEKLQKYFDEKSKVSIDPNTSFYGVTTKTISSAILKSTASTREILVTVKKEEITATTTTPKISFKILSMSFQKVGDDFKLDGIYWQG